MNSNRQERITEFSPKKHEALEPSKEEPKRGFWSRFFLPNG